MLGRGDSAARHGQPVVSARAVRSDFPGAGVSWPVSAGVFILLAVQGYLLGGGAIAGLWIVVAVVSVVRFLLSARVGVTLTPDAAIVQGGRRRAIPWTSVRDVVAENWWNVTHVVLLEADRRTRLPVPRKLDWRDDAGFDDALREIRAWLALHRGGA